MKVRIQPVKAGDGEKIHAFCTQWPYYFVTVCGKERNLHQVDEPVTCKSCLKILKKYELEYETSTTPSSALQI